MTKPNFLIIGAARSGTSALAEFLRQHPDVFFSDPKEPHFLSFAGETLRFQGRGDDIMMNQRAITDEAGYWKLFDGAKSTQAVGEGSVSTLYYHAQSIPRIQTHLPDVKLIVVLRNPIDRAFSSYLYMRSRGHEEYTDFHQALDAEAWRMSQHWHHIWHYTHMGFYEEQLAPFRQAFGDRMRVYLHEDMTQCGTSFFQDIYTFLGVDPSFRPKTEIEINRSGEPKNQLLQRLIRETVRRPWLRTLVRTALPRQLRMRLQSGNLKRDEMPAEARRRLTQLYTPRVRQLSKMLGRDLEPWLQGESAKPQFALDPSPATIAS